MNAENILNGSEGTLSINTSQDNVTLNRTSDSSSMTTVRYVIGTILILYIPPIIISNFFVIITSLLFKRLKNPDNLLLASLALADFLVGAIAIPLSVVAIFPKTRIAILGNEYACLAWAASTNFALCSSLVNLLLICVERFIAVCMPLRYETLLPFSRVCYAVEAMWFVNLNLFAAPVLVLNHYDHKAELDDKCLPWRLLPTWYSKYFLLVVMYFCLTVSFALYAYITFEVITHIRKPKPKPSMYYPSTNTNTSTWSVQSTVKSTVVLLPTMFMMLFVVLWLPLVVVLSMHLVVYPEDDPEKVGDFELLALGICYFNSFTNSMVYAMSKKEYKQASRLLLTVPPCHWQHLYYMDLNTIQEVRISCSSESFLNVNGDRSDDLRRTASFYWSPEIHDLLYQSQDTRMSNKLSDQLNRCHIRNEDSGSTLVETSFYTDFQTLFASVNFTKQEFRLSPRSSHDSSPV